MGDSGLKRDDPRIRSVPFSVRRPSFVEVKRIHHILSTVEVEPYDPATDLEEISKENMEEFEAQDIGISENQKESLMVQDNGKTQEDKIADAIIRNDLDALIELFNSDYPLPVVTDANLIRTPVYIAVETNLPRILEFLLELDTGDLDSNIPSWFYRTALHRAAFDGRQDLVKMLLDAGANPAPKDIHGKTPYILANQQIRDFFRRYAGENPQYDWIKFGINPLTPEMEEEKKQKLADKKRRKKQQAKIRLQEKKKTGARRGREEKFRTTRSRTEEISHLLC